ncbi:unnamed protein product [Zymoseptoria tritici ST99CH_1E4]|uniref:ATP-dependent DNA helicase n=1 Tax=Zymoseptoria tritici ST99CH_1E4 TaxID=1276532 RepID=A0A2H1GCW3_ZYMTR|nr:unnamed protein product [Zymoseptoria tritici ST99CH_1E4]
MLDSDDFGIDDDDTEFLDAATQIAASQHGGFDLSPRPAKRQRLTPSPEDEIKDDEFPASYAGPGGFTQVSNMDFTQAEQDENVDPDIDEEGYYFPGELAPDPNAAKQSKYKIHVPTKGGKFPDMVFTQTQHGLDEDPTKFRGAIWKRPPKPPVPAFGMQNNAAANIRPNGNGVAAGAAMRGIGSYFKSARAAPPVEEDDAALAARLQAEENGLGLPAANPRQNFTSQNNFQEYDMTQELADLPSDAFSSSSPEKSPAKGVIELSSQLESGAGPPQRLRGPQTGLKQLTIFGQPATQGITASQAAKKRHAWPLANKEEPPTHHKLDDKEMKSWVYPTNLGTIRDYQYNIVSRSLFHNTLVALPTGLGKTFIAATVMLNYYRWTTSAQIVFMAPTKPLIAQQLDACYGIVGIPRRDTVLMTGETTPGRRAEEWLEKRVFFMTPQTVINDLKTGICDPKRVVLLVVDEAHKATGGYAYTEVIAFMRRFNNSFRVLALTATPGSTVEAVQAVIDNLGIARVELRTEQSIDIRQYTHEKHTETEVFDYSEEQRRIMDLFSQAVKPSLEKLCSNGAYWSRDPMAISAYGLTQSRQKWASSEAGRKAPMPVKGMLNAIFNVLSRLAHNVGLLKFHGVVPFYTGVLSFEKEVTSGLTKSKTAAAIANSEPFVKMMGTIRSWTNNPDFIGHPKLEYLREVVLNHFLDAGEGRQGSDVPPSATRVMVFASYRDSTEDICRVLKRNEPMIRPHVFVGQAASKGSEGMDQKRQNAVIQDFKSGKYNCLVATSIGEEGLDIGTVDLIVCYDASSSPIRMLQRIGRTGRKRVGQVRLLLMKDKEEKDYAKAQDNYAYIQKTIADDSKYAYRDDQSPRILPREVKPIADKRPVDIPPENSQPIDLNERARKGRGKAPKRPPKKFHMPDNVRTGFVKASRIGSDDDSAEHAPVAQKKAAAKKKPAPAKRRQPSPTPEPEIAALPYLADVVLTDAQQQELETAYARTADDGADALIQPIDAASYPAAKLVELGPTKHIRHGRMAELVQKTMRAICDVDNDTIQRLEENLHLSDLEDAGPARSRLVKPRAEPARTTSADSATAAKKSALASKPRSRPKKASAIDLEESDADDLATTSRLARPAAKSKATALPAQKVASPPPEDSEPEEPTLPVPFSRLPPPRPTPVKRKRAAPRKSKAAAAKPAKPRRNQPSYGSGAEEGASSSPIPSPTQRGAFEELGSEDTSGAEEEEEEEMDSEMAAWIAPSDEVVEAQSSSQVEEVGGRRGGRLKKKGKGMALEDLMEESEREEEDVVEVGGDEEEGVGGAAVQKGRRRRVVEDSDSEE